MTAPDAYAPLSPTEKLEEDASLAGLAAAEALRGIEVAAVVLIGLLVCPPLAILVFLVVVPAPRRGARPRADRRGPLDAVPARPPPPRPPSRPRVAVRCIASATPAEPSSISLPHRLVADAREGEAGR